jgi:hypothetical protein
MAPKKIKKNKKNDKTIETNEIKITDIIAEVDVQSRVGLNNDFIDEYAEDLELGAEFPSVDVFYDGTYYFLTDGFHRYGAYKKVGKESITANIHHGTRRDAILFSVGVNAKHGIRRTNADKQRAVRKLLDDDEWAKMSDGEIAKHCAVSQPFVSKLRRELTQNGSESSSVRKGADGRDIDTSKIGKNNGAVNGKEAQKDSVTDDSLNEKSTDDEGANKTAEFELDVSDIQLPDKTKTDKEPSGIESEKEINEEASAPKNQKPKVSDLITDIIGQLTELQKLKPDVENKSESDTVKIVKILDKLKQNWLEFNLLFKDLPN